MENNQREITAGDEFAVEIEKLGGLGDGVGRLGGRPVFVPYTLPGDEARVRVERINNKLIRAGLIEVLRSGAERVPASCPHFTRCGGCDLQHLARERYLRFKRAQLQEAVARTGFDPELVEQVVEIGPASRRRAAFKIDAAADGTVTLGFYARGTHRAVDIAACPVLTPGLQRLIEPLRALTARLFAAPSVGEVLAVETDTGLDIRFHTASRLSGSDARRLRRFAEEQDIARIVWRGGGQEVTVVERRVPMVDFGGLSVSFPVGAFLQATKAGERAIAEIIVREAAEHTHVIDLYAGCGAWSAPLLDAGHAVTAYEGDAGMAHALKEAFDANGLNSRATVHQRDLYRDPVRGAELSAFDAAVANPPRTGAEPQIKALAQSDIPLILLVSCNPRALERDARHLALHGYELVSAKPVDQFHWSVHLESVAVFCKTPHVA